MKLPMLSLMALTLALSAGFAHADSDAAKDAAKDMKKAKSTDITATLEAKERDINEAIKAKDSAKMMTMIDSDGWMADGMGFNPVSAIPEMLKDMELRSYTMDGVKSMKIDKDAYILTYTWKGDATMKGQLMPAAPYYCSTVWAKRGNDWKAVYHQESMAAPMAPPTADSK